MTAERRDLVRHYLSRGRETIEEAQLLFGGGHLGGYVNRLYYACFYAALALLASRGMSSSKHTHVRAVLHKEFVRTGEVPADLAKHYDRLFNNRLEVDYGEFVRFERDEVAGWLEPTRAFVGPHPGGIGGCSVGSRRGARHLAFSA